MNKLQEQNHHNSANRALGAITRNGKYRIVGSSSLRAVPYMNKYELLGGKGGSSGDTLSRMLQRAYADALKNQDFSITSFQCGMDDRLSYRGDYTRDSVDEYLDENKHLIPIRKASALRKLSGEELIKQIHQLYLLRWSSGEVKKGKKKMIDGKVKLLKNAVMDNAPIKIELIGKIGDKYMEVMETIRLDGHDPTEEQQMNDVEDEVHFFSQNNAFKALKRFYSALQLHPEKENEPAMEKMVQFFNSQIGVLNKIRNELGIIEKVFASKRDTWDGIQNNLEHIKSSVSKEDEVFSTFTDMTKNNAIDKIREMMTYLSGVINDHSKTFLRTIAEL